jgi:nucleoside-diphosphate-sugar epimerase
MKILLTGATGLLGREVMGQLLDEGHDVSVIVRGKASGLDERVTKIELDLGSDWHPSSLAFDFESVIHLAQSREFRDFPNGSRDVFQVNINSTHKLLELARINGCESFVYASSGGVYADNPGAITEESPIGDPSALGFYLGSKASAEILCQSYSKLLTIVILRPFFIFGPGQNRQMLIPRVFDAVASGEAITLEGPDGMEFNPVHVTDAANLVVKSVSLKSSQVINVSGPTKLTLGEMVRIVANYLGIEPNIRISKEAAKNLSAKNAIMSGLIGRKMLSIEDRLDEIKP